MFLEFIWNAFFNNSAAVCFSDCVLYFILVLSYVCFQGMRQSYILQVLQTLTLYSGTHI